MPRSPEPGTTRRPPSVNTAAFGPRVNLAVCASAPAADCEEPMPKASEEEKPSDSTQPGAKCFNSPCLFSWLHIEPEEPMKRTEDRFQRPGLASRASSNRVEKARPTMQIRQTRCFSTSLQSSSALNMREGRRETVP